MSLQGSPDNWNPINIVVVDNYDPATARQGTEFDWLPPDYRYGRWVNNGPRRYVYLFIELNKIDQDAQPQRLASLGLLQDDQRLSTTVPTGGSVNGLESGKSVVLQNNGWDGLTVSSDGAFTFFNADFVGFDLRGDHRGTAHGADLYREQRRGHDVRPCDRRQCEV